MTAVLTRSEPTAAPPRPALRLAALAVALVVGIVGLLGIGVRATHGGQAAVDEPQYLLSALSLGEDGDLDIADELADRRWQAFSDAELPVQTEARPDGSRLSPHDPLLPLLLAAPMAVGGFVLAKATMVCVAVGTALLLLWVAVRRFGVSVPWAAVGVAVAFASAPLGVYAHQVYPEMPAALAAVVAVAALTGRLAPAGLAVLTAAVVALPWLGVKYAPIAATFALLGLVALWRAGRRRAAVVMTGALALAGIGYLAVHRAVWGGWTVYASGDHFSGTGEFSVVGVEPDYVGRSLRLAGLLVDRTFGLVAWQPAWLLLVPALAAFGCWRLCGARTGGALVWPLAVGYLMATFAALTMHGFWWPGRQLVVVLPLGVLLVLRWLTLRPAARGWLPPLALGLGLAGVLSLLVLLLDGWTGQLTWVVGFADVDDPLYTLRRVLLPDYRGTGAALWVPHVLWVAALCVLAVAGWRAAARVGAAGRASDLLPPAPERKVR